MRCFCPALASVGGDSNATGRERFSRLRCWPPGGHVPAVGRQHSPPRDVARRWTPTCFRREHLSVRLCQVRPFPLRTAQPQSVASWLRPHPAPRPATLAAGVGTHAGPRLLFLPPPGASDVFPALGPRARIQVWPGADAVRGTSLWWCPSGFPCGWVSRRDALAGTCPPTSRDALFFLCEQILSGPQTSSHLFDKQRRLPGVTSRAWPRWPGGRSLSGLPPSGARVRQCSVGVNSVSFPWRRAPRRPRPRVVTGRGPGQVRNRSVTGADCSGQFLW